MELLVSLHLACFCFHTQHFAFTKFLPQSVEVNSMLFFVCLIFKYVV